MTGQKNATLEKAIFFNPLYVTHHKFYGFMDYFYLSGPRNNTGLRDSYLNVNVAPAKGLNMQLICIILQTAISISDREGKKASSTLENEADWTLNYKIMKDAKLTGGYLQMFATQSMKYVKNILPHQKMKNLQNWVWFSVNVNPDILIFQRKTNETLAANK